MSTPQLSPEDITAYVEGARNARADQQLPDTIEDAATLNRVGAILSQPEKQSEKHRKTA
jgi:hypothetical protein